MKQLSADWPVALTSADVPAWQKLQPLIKANTQESLLASSTRNLYRQTLAANPNQAGNFSYWPHPDLTATGPVAGFSQSVFGAPYSDEEIRYMHGHSPRSAFRRGARRFNPARSTFVARLEEPKAVYNAERRAETREYASAIPAVLLRIAPLFSGLVRRYGIGAVQQFVAAYAANRLMGSAPEGSSVTSNGLTVLTPISTSNEDPVTHILREISSQPLSTQLKVREELTRRLANLSVLAMSENVTPGSLDAARLADYYDEPLFNDEHAYRYFKKFFKKIGRAVKKVAKPVLGVIAKVAPFTPLGLAATAVTALGSRNKGGPAIEEGTWTPGMPPNMPVVVPPPAPANAGRVRVSRYAVSQDGRNEIIFAESDQRAEQLAQALFASFKQRISADGELEFIENVSFDGGFMGAPLVPDAILSDAPIWEHFGRSQASLMPTGCEADQHEHYGFFSRDSAPAGEFYRSAMFRAKLTPLRNGLYGRIRLSKMPFDIDINTNVMRSRAEVAIVHECLHALNELLKVGMSHEQLHSFASYMVSEVIPAYLAIGRAYESKLD